MRSLAGPALAGLVLLSACADQQAVPVGPSTEALHGAVARVTSSADAGPGSLRQALADANANPAIGSIDVARRGAVVRLQSPLVYRGAQPLAIRGNGLTLDGAALGPGESIFRADGGASLAFTELTVRNAPGNGILVAVPADAGGTLSFSFEQFAALDNGFFGVLINDQAEFFTDPESTSDAGSDAGIVVRMRWSRIGGNGLAALDNDGFRINEGGPGSIDAQVFGTRFAENGADGLELDERGPGDAGFSLEQVVFTRNGAFDVVTDPDDGIDVDEAGDGDVVGRFVRVDASDNSEQGVDLNENDAGNLRVTMDQVQASRNGQEGIEFEEDDDVAGGGDIVADLRNVTTDGNGLADDGDAGLKLREKGAGNLFARVVRATSSGNLNGLDGILFREDSSGDMDVQLAASRARANDGDGVRFQGTGVARAQAVDASGNAGDQLRADAGVVLTRMP